MGLAEVEYYLEKEAEVIKGEKIDGRTRQGKAINKKRIEADAKKPGTVEKVKPSTKAVTLYTGHGSEGYKPNFVTGGTGSNAVVPYSGHGSSSYKPNFITGSEHTPSVSGNRHPEARKVYEGEIVDEYKQGRHPNKELPAPKVETKASETVGAAKKVENSAANKAEKTTAKEAASFFSKHKGKIGLGAGAAALAGVGAYAYNRDRKRG